MSRNVLEKVIVLGVLLIMSLSTVTFAKDNPSEEEAVLPIKISRTDMEVDVRIQSVTQTKDGNVSTKDTPDQKLGKLEIHRKSVDSTYVDITYEIKVTNKGNATGTVDKIFVFLPQSLSNPSAEWETESATVLTSSEFGEIEPNETVSKTITISDNASNIIGTSKVSAMIISQEDIDQRIIQKQEDTEITGTQDETKIKNTNNYAEASMIISISTGYEYIGIIVMIFLTLLILAIGLYFDKKIYDRKNSIQEE